jgi:hypothetical protein
MVHERSVVRWSGASLEKILEDLGYGEDLVRLMGAQRAEWGPDQSLRSWLTAAESF